jgi:hypothetical protein
MPSGNPDVDSQHVDRGNVDASNCRHCHNDDRQFVDFIKGLHVKMSANKQNVDLL